MNPAPASEPLDSALLSGGWTPMALERRADGGGTCLERGLGRGGIYGCAAPEENLWDVGRDSVFVLYPVPLDKSGARAPRGTISVDGIVLTYRLTPRKPAAGS